MVHIFTVALSNAAFFHEFGTGSVVRRPFLLHLLRGVIATVEPLDLARCSVRRRVAFLSTFSHISSSKLSEIY
jgi:hypothetical protein